MCVFMQLLCLPKGLFSVKLVSVNEVSCVFLILTCVSNVCVVYTQTCLQDLISKQEERQLNRKLSHL